MVWVLGMGLHHVERLGGSGCSARRPCPALQRWVLSALELLRAPRASCAGCWSGCARTGRRKCHACRLRVLWWRVQRSNAVSRHGCCCTTHIDQESHHADQTRRLDAAAALHERRAAPSARQTTTTAGAAPPSARLETHPEQRCTQSSALHPAPRTQCMTAHKRPSA